ncbi:hypothetical protein TWF481_006184 [Arthrobotrys musiformis]|uniref:Uncharacterized protein n=1 Tax=Arthrobotrys musiformis TaxID=47236 RepID=A0AAV9WG06_9PEZI
MLAVVSVHLVLLSTCLALPPGRQVPSLNYIPEREELNVPWGPGGLADMPEIVDETNLANPALNQQAVQAATGAAAVENTLSQIAELWNPFLDPDFNPPDANTDPIDFTQPINLVIANMLAGINPPAILNGPPVANQHEGQVQQAAVLIDEDDEEDAYGNGSFSLDDIIQIDFSEDPSSTGLGNMDDLDSHGSQPFATHPMAKRSLDTQESDRDAQAIQQSPQQKIFKREEGDLKIITPAQWEFWYEALNETAFAPLYDNIHKATDLGLDLEQAAFQVARFTKGDTNPNAFLKLVFYPMYDKIKGFALVSDGEDMAKELFDYQEPVKGMVEVNDNAIKEFLEENTDSSLAFSAAAANIAGSARKVRFTTNKEAATFESWVKDPQNREQGLAELIKDLAEAIDNVFSALSTLQSNYGFLGAQYEDVDFEEMAREVDEDIVVDTSPVTTSVRFDVTSSLDPEGDMFKSRELPKVLPPGAWPLSQTA